MHVSWTQPKAVYDGAEDTGSPYKKPPAVTVGGDQDRRRWLRNDPPLPAAWQVRGKLWQPGTN